MSRKLSSIVLVLFLVLCAAGAAYPLPLEPEAAEAPAGAGLLDGIWDRLLDWIDQVVGGEGGVVIRELEGCHLDPNGALSCPVPTHP